MPHPHLFQPPEVVRSGGHPPVEVGGGRSLGEHFECRVVRVEAEPPMIALSALGVFHHRDAFAALEGWKYVVQAKHQFIPYRCAPCRHGSCAQKLLLLLPLRLLSASSGQLPTPTSVCMVRPWFSNGHQNCVDSSSRICGLPQRGQARPQPLFGVEGWRSLRGDRGTQETQQERKTKRWSESVLTAVDGQWSRWPKKINLLVCV